ncbi:MAG TPA: CDP-glucose 4,6-dehydratase, partial [Solirubrobacteraceae bacterium]|nr:CDP-glucose 4,6-dehydratase [Solirubrobacteraceae bacterium]
LPPEDDPNLFDSLDLGKRVAHKIADVRARDTVVDTLRSVRPDVVFHLAAQSRVRQSYRSPIETFETNVMGTVNLLDAVRRVDGVRVVVNVTSDKCYENREWEWGYREGEPLGGHDPYASSKACSELVTSAYRRSFFADPDGPRIATARAGNVIGGGDWGEDRLVADLTRAAAAGSELRVRNPSSIRPWQHVLNPLSGYLLLAEALWDEPAHAGAWNFGPAADDCWPVSEIVGRLSAHWPGKLRWATDPGPHPHEAHSLRLDSSRARQRLGWRPSVGLDDALESVAGWHGALAAGADMRAVTLGQIDGLPQTAWSPRR